VVGGRSTGRREGVPGRQLKTKKGAVSHNSLHFFFTTVPYTGEKTEVLYMGGRGYFSWERRRRRGGWGLVKKKHITSKRAALAR